MSAFRALIVLLAVSNTVVAQSLSFPFESENEFDSFIINGNLTHSPGNGVGGSGAIQPEALTEPSLTKTALVLNTESFRFSHPGDSVAMAIMFKFGTVDDFPGVGSVGYTIASLRLYGEQVLDTITTPHISANFQLVQLGEGAPVVPRVSVANVAGSSGIGRVWEVEPLTDGNWYTLSAEFSYGAASNHFLLRLDDFGPTGDTFVKNVAVRTRSTSGPYLLTDDTVWPGFHVSRISQGGAVYSDNFQIIPEPNALLLTTMAAVGLLVRVRSRVER